MTDPIPVPPDTGSARILYVPHGGGPLPLLGDPGHEKLIAFLQGMGGQLGKPEAILVISAHWEELMPVLTGSEQPDLIYDYGGFPPESYQIQYPAPGHPALAAEIATLLDTFLMPALLDADRGFDHGMFVPLKLMFPNADIPCIQLSLLNNLDAASHIALGKVLAPLKKKNILILGSGMSFHNIRAFFQPELVREEDNLSFEDWLQLTCSGELDEAEREQRLANWKLAPAALAAHPRPEHLLPLHVCYGIAGKKAETVFSDEVMGRRVSGFLW